MTAPGLASTTLDAARAAEVAEKLPLVDGELLLWHRVDLGGDDNALMRRLIAESDWRQERITVYGKSYLQPRLSAWYGDFGYRYSGIRLAPAPWSPLLAALKERVEALTATDYNSVLLNYYRDHNDSMGMHADDERELGSRPAIASLSLGATREFRLKHRHDPERPAIRLPLPSGSLLLMRGETQRYWKHGIARQREPCGARLNLTFRKIVEADAPGRRS